MADNSRIHPPSSGSHLRSIFIAGPTAVGKSEIALALAERLGGEIISVDSMQVYRGLDIGTAKPSPSVRARVPHHLIDICDLDESFDAAQFILRAQRAVADIQSRQHVPVFCGGTGLYFKAYLSGLGDAPAADSKLRAELEALPFEALLHELRERDPAAYERIDKQNPRRVIRAVEVIRLTGRRFSEQRTDWKRSSPNGDGKLRREDGKPGEMPSSIRRAPSAPFFCLTRQPADLHARINARVDEMFRLGLVAETRELLARGLARNRTALQAIGYRQVAEHLGGRRSLPETIELVKLRTRQFARRQLTWFRRQMHPTWIPLQSGEVSSAVATRLLAG